MTAGFSIQRRLRFPARLMECALMLTVAVPAMAQPPTLASISPSVRSDITTNAVTVTLTGTGLDQATIVFTPAGFITANVTNQTATSITATFVLQNGANGSVKVQVKNGAGISQVQTFDTGIICLDSAQAAGSCQLRWEIEGTTATGSSNQSNTKTTPNLLVRLDYQLAPPKEPQAVTQARATMASARAAVQSANQALQLAGAPLSSLAAQDQQPAIQPAVLPLAQAQNNLATAQNALAAKLSVLTNPQMSHQSFGERFALHAFGEIGYTQVPAATKLNPTSTTTSTNPATTNSTCTNSSATATSTSGTCTAAAQQQAFVVNGGGTLGVTFGRNGQGGLFTDLGLGVRGSWQYLVPANQVIQNAGITYVDLNSLNPQNVIGLYEGTAHFKLSQWGHNVGTNPNGNYHNVSDLVSFEVGYQNNSGLQGLAANPSTSTRNRFVGRVYFNPQLNNSNHTTILIGAEYNAGINGGEHVVQIFFGTNVNPLKLLNPTKSSTSN
jgi:hypothetical protein